MDQSTLDPLSQPDRVGANLPVGPSAFQQSETRLKREDATSTGNYVGAMWRQDGLVDGLVANIAGRELMPDPDYSPFQPGEWEELTKGIQDDLIPHLYDAHSPAHARYLKDRLLDKQKDLEKLGDLGWKGNVGRFAFNAVLPDQLLMSMAGGWAARGVRLGELGRAAKAATPLAAAEARAGVVAAQATQAASKTALATGVAVGAAENAVYEKMRQSVNFEDDSAAVIEVGLLGAAITTPFALAGARAERRIASAARKEHEVLKVMRAVDDGTPLTPDQARMFKEVHDTHKVIEAVHAGRMSVDDARVELGKINKSLDDEAAAKLPDDLKEQGQAMLDSMFPERMSVEPKAVTPELRAERTAKVAAMRAERAAAAAAKAEATPTPIQALFETPAVPKRVDQDLQELRDMISTAEMPKAPEVPQVSKPQTSDRTGELVTWTHPKTGDELDGTVKGVNEAGFLQIEDIDGKMHVVHPSRLDQAMTRGEVPEGFLGGSIGAAQVLPMRDVSGQRSRMNVTAPGGAPLRWDIYATLNRSESEAVRKLTYDLVKDPTQNDDAVAQGMAASEWKSQIKRTVAGMFHKESREAAREARKIMGVPVWRSAQFNQEFHSLVSRMTRGDATVSQANQPIAAQLAKASAAQKKVYTHLLDQAKKAGVKGAEGIPDNGLYVNRIWNHRNIQDAILTHGADHVHEALARAINVPGYIGDAGKAARFLGIVRKLEFSPAMQNIHLYSKDMATLRESLRQANLADDEVDDIIELMFEAQSSSGSDAGRAGSLKYRFDIDENLAVKTPAGELRIADLFENDSRVLVDVYTNSMGGHIGLAKKDIYSQADFNARLEEARTEMLAHPERDYVQFARELRLAQDVYNNITGKPMSTQDFSMTARVASVFRGYTRSVMLGQLGLAAAFEMKQAVGLMGFRTLLQQAPTFSQFFRSVRNGYIPDVRLARDIEHISGFGTEMSAAYARAQEIEDGFFGQMLTRAESGANKASHAVDIMSGNASFTSITRQLTGMMATQYFHDLATGVRKLTPEVRTRLVGQGLNEDEIDIVFGAMKRYTVARPADGKVEAIDWEEWLLNESGTYEQFQLALSRQVRDAIQDQDLGETMPFMHSTLGKMFSELKTFFLVAHAKNFLKNASYMDATAFQVWAIGFVGESLAYMTQQTANNVHDPDKLAENLSPDRIATAAMFRSASLGLVPFVAETSYNVLTGGDSLVQPGTTTNTDTRSFLNTPSLTVAKRLLNAPATATGLTLGTDTTTRQEGRDLWGIVPGNNTYGFRMLGNYLSNSLPASDPDKQGR